MYILAGKYKGRKLLSPPTDSVTRPVTGAVKKSLFGMLGLRVEDAVVVDLFCGTGTMGLEALSQGARACWFGEADRRVIDRLRRNIEAFGAAGECKIWPGDVTRGLDARLEQIGSPVDLAFVDPPYETARQWSWRAVADTIFFPLYRHLAEEGVVALRLPQDVTLGEDMGGLVVERMRQYGKMVLALLGRSKADAGKMPAPQAPCGNNLDGSCGAGFQPAPQDAGKMPAPQAEASTGDTCKDPEAI